MRVSRVVVAQSAVPIFGACLASLVLCVSEINRGHWTIQVLDSAQVADSHLIH